MKHIGREVLFLPAGDGNPRNGESTMIRLRTGNILFVYTQYYGDSWEDHAIARLAACLSEDEGETWSAPFPMIEKDEGAQNIMSPSLVRMPDGDLGILYLRKEKMPDNGVTCMPVFRRSSDEGLTWSAMQPCAIPEGYYCGINDGAVCLKNGRIVYPVSYHGLRYNAFGNCTLPLKPHPADIRFVVSDDNGTSWQLLPAVLETPYTDTVGLAEPGVYEHEDGTLWCWFRTGYGFQYHSHSRDGGVTWDPAEPNFCFTSPDAPMRVKKVGDRVAAVFNPQPFNCLRTDTEVWSSPKRTPIVCALSDNDGHSFADRGITSVNGGLRRFTENTYLLETDLTNSYCYPSIQEVKDGFLVSYYHSNNTPACLNSSKVVKIRWDEL